MAHADNRTRRLHLHAPYADRHKVKRLGARWDGSAGKWYVTTLENIDELLRWVDLDELRAFRRPDDGRGNQPAAKPAPKLVKQPVAVPMRVAPITSGGLVRTVRRVRREELPDEVPAYIADLDAAAASHLRSIAGW